MKRLNRKKNKHFINVALIVLILCIMGILIFEYAFCATIYQNDIRDNVIDKNIDEMEREVFDRSKIAPAVKDDNIKPTAESTIDPNILYTTKKTWEKEKKNIHNVIIQKETVTPSEATHEYKAAQKYTYIRHNSSITTVSGDYLWEDYVDDDNETYTRLFIYHSDDEQGLPHYAYSGFYMIDGDTYCFDKKGNLIKGMAMDEYDVIYEFDSETGRLLKKYKKE